MFGQSTGASSAFIISTLPEAPSLINAMASSSGGGQLTQTYGGSQKLGAKFAKSINCSITDVKLTIHLKPNKADLSIECVYQI